MKYRVTPAFHKNNLRIDTKDGFNFLRERSHVDQNSQGSLKKYIFVNEMKKLHFLGFGTGSSQ